MIKDAICRITLVAKQLLDNDIYNLRKILFVMVTVIRITHLKWQTFLI